MCSKKSSSSIILTLLSAQPTLLVLAALGLCCGVLDIHWFDGFARGFTSIFMDLLKLVSLPIIFLAIVATVGGMETGHAKALFSKLLFYTLLTTLLAAVVSLILYQVIRPDSYAHLHDFSAVAVLDDSSPKGSYWAFLLESIPNNVVAPFLNQNVLGVLFLALLLSAALKALPREQSLPVSQVFSGLFAALLKIIGMFMLLMPIAVFCFMILFVQDVKNGLGITALFYYILCVIGANLLQAGVVLPTLLLLKGVHPGRVFKAMFPALTVAFFSKSSAASLPSLISCAEDRLGLSPKLTRFSFPLCTTINMNACAGFILITVLFVSSVSGVTFTPFELVSWVFIATIAAVGNAAVPMGCYFLASSFLASQDLPLTIMGAILPFYVLLDMLETAINVWSDSCVTAILAKTAAPSGA